MAITKREFKLVIEIDEKLSAKKIEDRFNEVFKLAGVAIPPIKITVKGKTLSEIYTPAFLEFWKAYPARRGVKAGKMPSFKSWQQSGVDEDELKEACLEALEWQKRLDQWTENGGQYVPLSQTYLNGRRWEDENPTPGEKEGMYQDDNGEWQYY